MKILYLITKSNWGGAQRYVYDLAAHFSMEVGFDVVVALGGDGALKKKLQEKNIRVIQLAKLERDIKITGDIRTFFAILKLLRGEMPDIVHLNSTKAGLLGSIAVFSYNLLKAKSYELKAIFTAHGFAFNEKRPWWQKIIIGKIQWLTMFLSDHTIVVSEHLKKQVRFWPFISHKISVIHNGISDLSFLPREEAVAYIEKSFGELRGTRIVTIAELHKNKGLDVATEAIALLGNMPFKYVIIGDGEEKAALESLIKKKNLEDRVFIAGHIDDAYKFLKAFDIFLLPSRTEALAYALLEAGSAGLPVVATAVGGIPEVITHKKTGLLVPTENPRALAHALQFMIENPDARTDAARELHNTVKNRFSLKTMFEKTRYVYDAARMD